MSFTARRPGTTYLWHASLYRVQTHVSLSPRALRRRGIQPVGTQL